jgi:hypothetical protein
MRYAILVSKGIEVAREALSQRQKVPDLSAFEAVVGAGDPLDESILKTVASKIRKAQAELSKKKLGPEELDRVCFDVLHAAIPRDQLLLADMGFWTRFAIVELADVIHTRFPGRLGKTNLDNFGLGSRKECWPYKLWVRGELAYDENGKDKYHLGRLGGVEMWTSHVHRQNFMTVRQLFRSVFTFQFPEELKGKPYLFEGEEAEAKGGKPGIRTLIKRLRENWASVEYSLLTEREATALVRIHSKGLHRADGKHLVTTA